MSILVQGLREKSNLNYPVFLSLFSDMVNELLRIIVVIL